MKNEKPEYWRDVERFFAAILQIEWERESHNAELCGVRSTSERT